MTVSISDTGIGMPGEVQKHIFEKFYQGDASHSTNGTGLGLALAKRITDLHGGSISVRVKDHWFELDVLLPQPRTAVGQ